MGCSVGSSDEIRVCLRLKGRSGLVSNMKSGIKPILLGSVSRQKGNKKRKGMTEDKLCKEDEIERRKERGSCGSANASLV